MQAPKKGSILIRNFILTYGSGPSWQKRHLPPVLILSRGSNWTVAGKPGVCNPYQWCWKLLLCNGAVTGALSSRHGKAAWEGGQAIVAHLKLSTRPPGRKRGGKRAHSSTCWDGVPGSERTAKLLGWKEAGHYCLVVWGLRAERSPRFESVC